MRHAKCPPPPQDNVQYTGWGLGCTNSRPIYDYGVDFAIIKLDYTELQFAQVFGWSYSRLLPQQNRYLGDSWINISMVGPRTLGEKVPITFFAVILELKLGEDNNAANKVHVSKWTHSLSNVFSGASIHRSTCTGLNTSIYLPTTQQCTLTQHCTLFTIILIAYTYLHVMPAWKPHNVYSNHHSHTIL
jgi:hypothetical protein